MCFLTPAAYCGAIQANFFDGKFDGKNLLSILLLGFIAKYPLLKESVGYGFPIVVTYGEKDIYGKSRQYVRTRFPKATFVEYANAGHLAWKNRDAQFIVTLTDFYRLS